MSNQPQSPPVSSPNIAPDGPVLKQSVIHGTGAFARHQIPRGTRIIEYLGERIDKAESLRRCEAGNQFIFTLNDRQDLDGSGAGNPARFINHSCTPSCEAELEEDRIWIIAAQDISADDELTFNYAFDLADYRQYPCHCGAADCVGFIVAEEFFDHVRGQNHAASAKPSAASESETVTRAGMPA